MMGLLHEPPHLAEKFLEAVIACFRAYILLLPERNGCPIEDQNCYYKFFLGFSIVKMWWQFFSFFLCKTQKDNMLPFVYDGDLGTCHLFWSGDGLSYPAQMTMYMYTRSRLGPVADDRDQGWKSQSICRNGFNRRVQ